MTTTTNDVNNDHEVLMMIILMVMVMVMVAITLIRSRDQVCEPTRVNMKALTSSCPGCPLARGGVALSHPWQGLHYAKASSVSGEGLRGYY